MQFKPQSGINAKVDGGAQAGPRRKRSCSARSPGGLHKVRAQARVSKVQVRTNSTSQVVERVRTRAVAVAEDLEKAQAAKEVPVGAIAEQGSPSGDSGSPASPPSSSRRVGRDLPSPFLGSTTLRFVRAEKHSRACALGGRCASHCDNVLPVPTTAHEVESWLCERNIDLRNALELGNVATIATFTGLLVQGAAKLSMFRCGAGSEVNADVEASYGLWGVLVGEASNP